MVVAHIGLMKTASTSIQNLLQEDKRIITRVHWSQYYSYNQGEKEITNDRVIFISDENLSRAFNKVESIKKSLINLESYHRLSTVLIIIREQFDFLNSAYKHHVKQTTDHFDFKKWLESEAGISQLKLCDYMNLDLEIRTILPHVKTVFLPFEMIAKDEAKFLNALYLELGLNSTNKRLPSANKAFDSTYYLPKLLFNKIVKNFKRLDLPPFERGFIWIARRILLNRRIKTTELLSSHDKELLRKQFSESNTYISRIHNINLKELGYL